MKRSAQVSLGEGSGLGSKVIYTCLFWWNGTERNAIESTLPNEREILVPFGLVGCRRSFSTYLQLSFPIEAHKTIKDSSMPSCKRIIGETKSKIYDKEEKYDESFIPFSIARLESPNRECAQLRIAHMKIDQLVSEV
uniref:Uncharacterized protein n=1 Tax=Romanomermis culicivorax TaxID=13658 RepID=A0A915KR38_ROMCU